MTLSPIELHVHRRNTKRFINSDLTTIVLKTRVESTVAGTKIFVDGEDREPQSFKIIWPGDNGIVRDVGSEGAVHRFDFIIVGEYTAQVDIGDYWRVGGQEYRIEYIFPHNGYEVKAGGVSHGSKPNGSEF